MDYQPWHHIPFEQLRKAAKTQKQWKQEDIDASVTPWERSQIRAWLNREFFDRAFHSAEKSLIIERLNTGNGAYMHRDYQPVKGKDVNINTLTDDTYEKYEQRSCADTRDKVFLLNVEEALKYFGKNFIWPDLPENKIMVNPARISKPTEFVVKRGYISLKLPVKRWYPVFLHHGTTWKGKEQVPMTGYKDTVYWWLRNIGSNDLALTNAVVHKNMPAYVCWYGTIQAGGIDQERNGVRPAIFITNEERRS